MKGAEEFAKVWKTCPHCSGKGCRHHVEKDPATGGDILVIDEKCLHCGGKGEVTDGTTRYDVLVLKRYGNRCKR